VKLEARQVIVIGALLFVTLAPSVLAQEDSSWLRVDIVQVVPEKLDDFIELQFEEVNMAYRRAGVRWRSAWQTAEFGNTYERWFATPIASLDDFDGGGPLARALDPDRLARIRDQVRRTLVSRESFAVRYRPDLSVESDAVSGLNIARMTLVQIAPGRGADWEAFLRDSMPRFREANVVFGVYQRMYGPGPTMWQIVQNHSSFAELGRPGIVTQAFGEDADTAFARLADVVVSIEQSVLRYDPELSFSALAP